jgi:hypothetical protein
MPSRKAILFVTYLSIILTAVIIGFTIYCLFSFDESTRKASITSGSWQRIYETQAFGFQIGAVFGTLFSLVMLIVTTFCFLRKRLAWLCRNMVFWGYASITFGILIKLSLSFLGIAENWAWQLWQTLGIEITYFSSWWEVLLLFALIIGVLLMLKQHKVPKIYTFSVGIGMFLLMAFPLYSCFISPGYIWRGIPFFVLLEIFPIILSGIIGPFLLLFGAFKATSSQVYFDSEIA